MEHIFSLDKKRLASENLHGYHFPVKCLSGNHCPKNMSRKSNRALSALVNWFDQTRSDSLPQSRIALSSRERNCVRLCQEI